MIYGSLDCVDVKLRGVWNIGETRRMYHRKPDGKCSRCDAERAPGSRYCRPCKNDYMRDWRKAHPLTGEAKKRALARSYAHVYRDRGLIEQAPCADCGGASCVMHHEDYSRPTDVVWLCRPCHLKRHGQDCHVG